MSLNALFRQVARSIRRLLTPYPRKLTAGPDEARATAALLGRPLIHEALLLGFCALMAARLLRVKRREGARLAALAYAAPALPYLPLIAYGCARAGDPAAERWQRARLLYPFILINLVFQATKPAVEMLGRQPCDQLLLKADRLLLGGDLGLLLDRHCPWAYHPVLAEYFSLNYSLFFICLTTSVLDANRRPLVVQISFSRGLWSLYAFGLLGYTLVPAKGPWTIFGDQYRNQIRGWFWTPLNAAVVARGTAVFDVFPSLHLAVPAFLLGWQRRFAPRWFRIWLAPMLLTWVSTIYLRYHYVVDLLAGGALARAMLRLARRQPGLAPERPGRSR